MLILALRTDRPEAEVVLLNSFEIVESISWHAHRQLADTLHQKINLLLTSHDLSLADLKGVVAYEGPGSFTGLRIGLSVANAIAMSFKIPIVGASSDEYKQQGVHKLLAGEHATFITPEYGAEVHITKQKK